MERLLKLGHKGPDVTALKRKLILLGYDLNDAGANRGVFGPKVDQAVRDVQESAGLTVDGWVGPKTMEAMDRAIAVRPRPEPAPAPEEPTPAPEPVTGSAPRWVFRLLSRLGWTEFTHDKLISVAWRLCKLAYTTVIGKSHAWCGAACADALNFAGLPYPKRAAGAASWDSTQDWADEWAEPCDFISGAFLPIRHAKGGRHITVFLYWIDKAKKIAACVGGNQNNGYRISAYNLSGNKAGHDQVIGTPMWPKGQPKTGWVYKPGVPVEDVGGSTR